MTDNENFLRIVKEMYRNLKPVDYTNKTTDIEKLEELKRWTSEFLNQTKNVEKMLESYIVLGLIKPQDKDEVISQIRDITTDHLNYLNSLG
ncbi:hypothetical protein [Chryseobacterium sp. PET-29]|uniref:hypothetical protein n=1 Tax=Chryseobacterium sp. PET-29 TaxID=2983267 RepID=UPI0021E604BE|nr:hypothetical protein [Chryseobacterium sp. PET-29]